jgi:hypothetical protein
MCFLHAVSADSQSSVAGRIRAVSSSTATIDTTKCGTAMLLVSKKELQRTRQSLTQNTSEVMQHA